ncbi:indolepyruvate oxidoreductase subunit beta [Propionicimonas sp.]|uniref:indolepyruvate oxidoreductase subunit beta n=1 Tax=Propionicimonas sp. TaxID=1955623 RepID=UPI0017D5FA2E|nr:indolepyruvate oxidoreductase subunit beta [Propionicimonas sp.]MBU3976080.1 indolepyruvate oxidoreductase subunit beta [Actinomycetota bacterium]MBA3020893.1 indolepyruvate oxidoreductase subunit beta [Propionicimonas sp.]MBU3985270.1 indolepyruvate oxidoreductase subunit beta [Actinomycetota bacterium]MBU4008260.1 indolepyruvate oxidoreductase subunit beta [Actinomycetota bacterium]MBU4064526.1 indolepyruvate oxidoreductase subunit beta [Actinomycetota bacterium]
MSGVFNVLMVGVGGQGIVLASDVLAEAAALAGMDVKKSEIHGMSRRGGPVFSHVRFGERVYSAVIDHGQADVVLAMEPMELVRWSRWARPGAAACYLAEPILPVGLSQYPDGLEAEISRLFGRVVRVELSAIRRSVPLKVRNTALLGATSVFFDLGPEYLQQALKALSPRGSYEANQAAFDLGRELATAQLMEAADVE